MHSHPKKHKLPNKKPSHRNAIIQSLLIELIRNERLQTTPRKGKLLKQFFDKLVNEAKKDSIGSKRNVMSTLNNEKAVTKLYAKLLPRLGDTTSGYVQSARTLPRKGDGAEQMILMVRGAEIRERGSRLSNILAKQDKAAETKPAAGRGIRNILGGGTKAKGTGKKFESLADTRRVST